MALAKLRRNSVEEKINQIEDEIEDADENFDPGADGKEEEPNVNMANLVGGGGDDGDDGDDEEEEGGAADDNEFKRLQDELKKKTPEELFIQFDTDGSGLIDFKEFQALLPQIGLKMSVPKMLKYFRLCDTDGSGEIDFEEFKTALYALDPDSGNPVGFRPNTLLTPHDAFEMFDEDGTGNIDEDEFFYVLEYMNLEVNDEKQEKLFNKYDADKSGYIDYQEFKKIWLAVCDVRKELEDRGVRVSKVALRSQLVKMLEKMLAEEEEREKHAIAEAKRWRQWQLLLKEKRAAMARARYRADLELRSALDAAGQVYVFGKGAREQFAAAAAREVRTETSELRHFDRLKDLWRKRVKLGSVPLVVNAKEQRDGGGGAKAAAVPEEVNWFEGIEAATNTVALWARRITQVSAGHSVMFGLSDTGAIYSWGGGDHWWFRLEADSRFQRAWRGDTTPRSQLLLGTTGKQEPLEEGVDDQVDWEEREADKLKVITQYFKVWKPAPGGTMRLVFLKTELMPKISYEELRQAAEVRGRQAGGLTRMELVDALHEDLLLERRVLGQRAHRRVRQLEDDILALEKKNRTLMAKRLRMEIEDMWAPLREVRAEEAAEAALRRDQEKHEEYIVGEQNYIYTRDHMKDNQMQNVPKIDSKGRGFELKLNGMTDRAGGATTPRGYAAVKQLAAGAAHVLAAHQSGELYTWGVGVSGRLGLDVNEDGDPQTDVGKPTLVQGLRGRPATHIAAGFSHTAAVVAGGDLFIWGSAQNGKLGLGDVHDVECYSSLPQRVPLPTRIRKVACGSAHTAAVGTQGELYVWGCGDGGRLGLGADRLDTLYYPARVDAAGWGGDRVAGVACGNSHTLLRTAVEEVWVGEAPNRVKALAGGRVLAAGSANALGAYLPAFAQVPGSEQLVARTVSAGFQHSALCTAEGELWAWGLNRDGCCGLPVDQGFAARPTFVPCMFRKPFNLALNRPARQSSVYNGQEAHLAVDGDARTVAPEACCMTQQDPQAFWEVDLELTATIQYIKIWNRADEPEDASMERAAFSKRLFPCWVMVSADPFEDKLGPAGLQRAVDYAVAKQRLTKDQRVTTWQCPDNTVGRYVRIQMEGFNFLHLAQVEVYGNVGNQRSFGRVSRVECGVHVTAAIIKPLTDPKDVNEVYKRAIQADSLNADILRQFETYMPFYDKHGRGDNLKGCSICKVLGGQVCEVCELKTTYRDDLHKMQLGPGGRLRRLDSIGEYLYNLEKPPLDYEAPVKKKGVMANALGGLKSKLKGAIEKQKTQEEELRRAEAAAAREAAGDGSEGGSAVDSSSEEEEVPEVDEEAERRKKKAAKRDALRKKMK